MAVISVATYVDGVMLTKHFSFFVRLRFSF